LVPASEPQLRDALSALWAVAGRFRSAVTVTATTALCTPITPVMDGIPLRLEPEKLGIMGVPATRRYGATLCVRKPWYTLQFRSTRAAR
jgi:hypothetical protein